MAHTPGPWTLKFFNRDVTGACYRPSFVVIGELSIRIGETQKHDADAHLIAAAPDLLEALENVIDAASEFDPRQHPRWPEIYKAALSAIHAARGKP